MLWAIFCYVWSWLVLLCGWFGAVSLVIYALPLLVEAYLYREQDLRKRYDARWAVVTGGSSGIGRAIVERCAAQCINVVVVALDEPLLHDMVAEMRRAHDGVEFRACGVDLGRPDGYMERIERATAELDVALVFNNAGFIVTSFFADASIALLRANVECNATSMLRITHHFANRLRRRERGGALFFTSSPANLMPQPFAACYAASKSFMTTFAASIAAELRADGVDVCVVHPSPIRSAFYDDTCELDAIDFFKRRAAPPSEIARCLFAAIGRSVVRDHSWYPVAVTALTRLVHYNVLANVMRFVLPLMPDYKVAKAQQAKTLAKQQRERVDAGDAAAAAAAAAASSTSATAATPSAATTKKDE